MLQTLRRWAKLLKGETPWYAKLFTALVVAYAFSPIDLIPDFIPVLGFIDDAILLPVGIWIALKLVPAPVLAEVRAQAQAWLDARKPKPQNVAAAVVVVLLWIVLAWLLWRWLTG